MSKTRRIRNNMIRCCRSCLILLAISTANPVSAQRLDDFRQKNVRAMDTDASLRLLVGVLNDTDAPAIQSTLLKGMLEGMEGQRDLTAPEGWTDLSARLDQSPNGDVRSFTQQLSQIFGVEGSTQRALATVQDSDATLSDRRTALASLLQQQRSELIPILQNLLAEKGLQIEAIRAHSIIEYQEAPDILLKRFDAFSPQAQRAVIETLATRETYARALLEALNNQTIPLEAVPVHVSRSLSMLLGKDFSDEYGVKPLSDDMESMMAHYKKMATRKALAAADAAAGRVLYEENCMSCHVLYENGGDIGPELTGSNRADLDYLLLNLVDPNYDVPDNYRMVTVDTTDGQSLDGIIREEDGQKLVLKMTSGDRVIAKSDIESTFVHEISMMPEGLLDSFSKEKVLDLIKYLQSNQQVELTK